MSRFVILSALLCASFTSACFAAGNQQKPNGVGIEKFDDRLDQILKVDAPVKKLASGFVFIEGPVWDRKNRRLLFSDVPDNKIYQYKNTDVSTFIAPVFTQAVPAGMNGVGSNGLTFDSKGMLTIAEHGNRRISKLVAGGYREVVITEYRGQRFNSPNDLVFDSKGNLYFTDPPYGLSDFDASPLKELSFNGVFRLNVDGSVDVLTKTLDRPNGIALSPDEKTLYVNNSKEDQVTMAYRLDGQKVVSTSVFFDANHLEGRGVPDGLKVDMLGNVFTTGPGGVLIIHRDGTHLGTISTGEFVANVAWGGSESGGKCENNTLYMTASTSLYSVQTLTLGCSP